MPKIKTKRKDIIRTRELNQILETANRESGFWLCCLIALSSLFGKRLSENLMLKKDDVYFEDGFLYVSYTVLKKKTRKALAVPKPYLKRITEAHPLTDHVKRYLPMVKDGEHLFKSKSGERLTRQLALYYLKKVSMDVWFHLFRESLATVMAEKGASEEELLHWFDWERVDTAHQYVKRGTKLTEKFSLRTW